MTRLHIMLLTAALLWGLGFVAQREAMSYLGPFSFTALRFAIGVLSLLPFYFFNRRREKDDRKFKTEDLKAGALVGLFLFLAVSAQQIGLQSSTASKAGFLTSLYMIMIPILGLFLGRRTSPLLWISILLALLGIFLMAVEKNFSICPGDLWLMLGALLWAVHFLLLAHYSPRLPVICLSMMQFIFCTIFSAIVALFTESLSGPALFDALPSLLYGGIAAVAIAFTLQVLALREANPVYASLILSTESIFAAIGGWLILGEGMKTRQLAGAALILFAVLLSRFRQNKIDEILTEKRKIRL